MMKHKKTIKHINILIVLVLLVFIAGVVLVLTNQGSGNPVPDMSATTPEGTNMGETPSETEGNEDTVIFPAATLTPAPTSTPAPTPTPALTPTPIPDNINELKQVLETYISKQSGRYGLYCINLVTGEEFGIKDKDEYIAASTTKLPMNLYLYKKIASGELDFDSLLTYTEEDYEFGSGTIKDSDYGTQYTIRETARLSVVDSDNCGINMIIRLLEIENIRKYMQDIGGTVYYGRRHRSCPYDLAVYARELYRFYLETPEIAGILIDDLQNTMWNDRINKYLPGDVKVSHKIGNFEGVYNDVGIVFDSKPYVLAVMSEDIEQPVAGEVIARISKKIYDYMESK